MFQDQIRNAFVQEFRPMVVAPLTPAEVAAVNAAVRDAEKLHLEDLRRTWAARRKAPMFVESPEKSAWERELHLAAHTVAWTCLRKLRRTGVANVCGAVRAA